MKLWQKIQLTLDQSNNRWLNFEKNHEEYLLFKGYSAKASDKDESIVSPFCINETDINNNMTYHNSED